MRMNFSDWYWIVGTDETHVWSSAQAKLIPANDATFTAWLGGGNVASRIASLSELRQVFAASCPGGMLDTYLAAKRFEFETGGITVGGQLIATDRESQALVNGAFNFVAQSPSTIVKFKKADGTFAEMNATAVSAVAMAVAAHVQACFAKEAELSSLITAGTITTRADVDTHFVL